MSEQSVNFYILPDSDFNNRHFFVFRLIEKAHAQGLPTLILTADSEQAQALDKLLWTAAPARFIAHEILSAAGNSYSDLPAIVISDNLNTVNASGFNSKVVIDLSYDASPLPFAKIMLVANQHAEILANARMKYQSYVNQGIKPDVHKISEKQLALTA